MHTDIRLRDDGFYEYLIYCDDVLVHISATVHNSYDEAKRQAALTLRSLRTTADVYRDATAAAKAFRDVLFTDRFVIAIYDRLIKSILWLDRAYKRVKLFCCEVER